jgi:GntR family transcriptional regulator
MQIRIDKSGPVPIHDQIKDQIIGLIHAGKLQAGDQLPTMRALSIHLRVNLNTVAHAYRELDAEGIIRTRRGEGTFVLGAAGGDDPQRRRQMKLHTLVKALFDEADRLGYTLDEVAQVVGTERAARAHRPHALGTAEENEPAYHQES